MASGGQPENNRRQGQGATPAPASGRRARFCRVLILGVVLALGGVALLGTTLRRRDEPEAPFSLRDSAAWWAAADQPLRREAIELADRLIRDLPGNRDALDACGWLLNGWGNNVEAVKCWEACLKLDPTFGPAYECIGRDALNRAEYERAVSLLTKALEFAPRLPEVRLHLAQALMHLDRAEEAARVLEEQVALWPSLVDGYSQLGQAQFQRRAYAEAKSAYEAAIRLDPSCVPALYGLATACERLGETEKAQQYRVESENAEKAVRADKKRRVHSYDEEVSLRRRLADDYTRAGRVYFGQGNLAEAEACWRRAAAVDPKHTESRQVLVVLLGQQDKPQDALALLAELCQIEPNNPLHHLNLGVAHTMLQQFDAAEAAFQAAVRAAPNASVGYAALARFYLKTGRKLPEALAPARKTVELEPTARSYFLLSQACAANGEYPGALTAIQRAVELDPGNPLYAEAYKQLQPRKPDENPVR